MSGRECQPTVNGRVVEGAPRFAAVFYDLDGTLVDSRPGIEASLRVAFARHAPGVAPPPLGELLGRPLAGLLRGALAGLDKVALPAVAATFTEHYDTQGWRLSHPYPGMSDCLRALAGAGVRQVVVTNKRRRPALAILDACGAAPFVERTFTPDSTTPPYPDKAAMACAAAAGCAVPGARLLVIGDSVEDHRMAQACGAAFAAAAWGYGDAVSVIAPGGTHTAPDCVVLHSTAEIVDLVMASCDVADPL